MREHGASNRIAHRVDLTNARVTLVIDRDFSSLGQRDSKTLSK
jgi:hypothetical protein